MQFPMAPRRCHKYVLSGEQGWVRRRKKGFLVLGGKGWVAEWRH